MVTIISISSHGYDGDHIVVMLIVIRLKLNSSFNVLVLYWTSDYVLWLGSCHVHVQGSGNDKSLSVWSAMGKKGEMGVR